MKKQKKKLYISLLVTAVFIGVLSGKEEIEFHFSANKAFYYLENGEYILAAEEFDTLISMRPNIYELYINKAVALANSEKYEDALKTFLEAEKINNSDPELYYNLAHLYDITGNEELKQACIEKGTELLFVKNIGEE